MTKWLTGTQFTRYTMYSCRCIVASVISDWIFTYVKYEEEKTSRISVAINLFHALCACGFLCLIHMRLTHNMPFRAPLIPCVCVCPYACLLAHSYIRKYSTGHDTAVDCSTMQSTLNSWASLPDNKEQNLCMLWEKKYWHQTKSGF